MAHPGSATRGHPATLVGSTTIVSGTSWTTVHETDFTVEGAASAWDAKAAGNLATRDINGVRWYVEDVALASDMDLDSNGLSIHIAGTEGKSDWWGSVEYMPRFFAYLTYSTNPIYAAAGYGQALCFQMIIESSTDVSANWDAYGMIVNDNYNTPNVDVQNRRIYVHPDGCNSIACKESNQSDNEAGSQHTLFETVLANGTVYMSSSTHTSFQDPMTITGYRAVSVPLTQTQTISGNAMNIDRDNLCVMFYAFSTNSSTSTGTDFTPTLKQFRVLSLGEEGVISP